MSRLVLALFALAAVAFAAPAREETSPVAILRESRDGPNVDGSYQYSYETDDGVSVDEQGHQQVIDADTQATQVQGGFSFTGTDGVFYKVVYVANENGFQPQGDHLPTPPPIPAQILKALEYNAAHPEEDHVDDN